METRGRNIDRTYHRSRSYLLHRHGIHIGQQWDDKETRRSMYIWCISTFLYRDSRLQWEAWDVGWRREFQFFEGEVRRENQNGPIDGQSLFLYRHWTTMEATWAYYGPISRGAQWLVPTRGDPLRIIEESPAASSTRPRWMRFQRVHLVLGGLWRAWGAAERSTGLITSTVTLSRFKCCHSIQTGSLLTSLLALLRFSVSRRFLSYILSHTMHALSVDAKTARTRKSSLATNRSFAKSSHCRN